MVDKITFKSNLDRLREIFPGQETITVAAAAAYFGCDEYTLREDPDFPLRYYGPGTRKRVARVPLASFARWLSV